jgi:hypothetical protein
MSSLFVVGHGINIAGIYESMQEANQTAADLLPLEINGNLIKATVMEVDVSSYTIDREKNQVIKCKGGNSYYLNSTLEDQLDIQAAEEAMKEPGSVSWDDVK